MFPGNDIVSSLIAVQMGGTGGKAKAKTITENGVYTVAAEEKAEGYVGYSPVTVNVPDRYQEGHEDGVNSVVINPLTVTANGTYNAADYGCNGFDPVNVNVPDRYDEGYQKGYEDGQQNGKYTFPDNTPYEDIVSIVGGDDVADETLGVQIKTLYWWENDNNNYHTSTKVYDLSGNELDGIWGWETSKNGVDTFGAPKVTHFTVTDSTTGAWEITYTLAKSGTVATYTGTSRYLIGFGESGHTYSVSNNG